MPYLPSLLLQRERDERLRRRLARGGGPSHLSGLGSALGGERRDFEFALAEAQARRSAPDDGGYGGAQLSGRVPVEEGEGLLSRLLSKGLIGAVSDYTPPEALNTSLLGQIVPSYEEDVARPVKKLLTGSENPSLGDTLELGATFVPGAAAITKGKLALKFAQARGKAPRPQSLPSAVASASPAERGQAALGAFKRQPTRSAIGLAAAGSLVFDKPRDILLKTPANLALATAEHPGEMLSATGAGVRDAALGIPQAVYEVGAAAYEALPLTPGGTERASEMWDMIKEDYSYRYGPLLAGDTKEFRDRALESGGLAPFAFDALIAAPGLSRVAGAGIRKGMLGSRARARILEQRPPMRIGGETRANEPSRYRRPLREGEDADANPLGRERSRGVVGAELQRLVDRRAVRRTDIMAGEGLGARKLLKPWERQNLRGTDPGRHRSASPTDALAVEARAAGEVVPANLPPVLNHFDRARRHVSKRMGAGQAGYKLGMIEAMNAARLAGSDLSPTQREAAITAAVMFRIETPEQARRVIGDHLNDIAENRARLAADPKLGKKYKGLAGTPEAKDYAKLSQGLIDNADEIFTPKLVAATKKYYDLQELEMRGPRAMVPGEGADLVPESDKVWRARTDGEVNTDGLRQGGADPGVSLDQALVRQHLPSAALLNMGWRRNPPTAKEPEGPDMTKEQMLQQEQMWGKRDYGPEGETPQAFAERVQAGMRAEYGITQIPGYVRSAVIGGKTNFSDWAKGGGSGVTAIEKRYGGVLHGLGVAELNESTLKRGLARSIKRKYQWQQVWDLTQSQAIPATFNGGRGRSPKWNAEYVNKIGADPADYVLFYPKMWDKQQADAGILGLADARPKESGVGDRPTDIGTKEGTAPNFGGDEQLHRAMKMDGEDSAFELLGTHGEVGTAEFGSSIKARQGNYAQKTKGAMLIKREVHQEINAQIDGATLFGRIWDKGMGTASGLILAMNLPWIGFQVLSNTAMSIVGGAGPMAWVMGNQFFRELKKADPAAYQHLASELHFQTSGLTDATSSSKLGKAAEAWDAGSMRSMAMTARGFWETPLNPKSRFASKIRGDRVRNPATRPSTYGELGKKLNPLDLLFRFDRVQNTFFRKGMFYSKARRDLWDKMGQDTTRVLEDQQKLAPLLDAAHALSETRTGRKLTAEGRQGIRQEQIRNMQKMIKDDPRMLERHAKSVFDYMGDWTSYTRAERLFLKRGLLFYGFLRFSLRMAFYTMPTKHPIMTGIISQMGRLETEEKRELLGEDANPWALGGIRTGENGETVWEMYRANPVLNALVEADDVRGTMNIMPPFVQILAKQFFQHDTFSGKQIAVGGIPSQGPHHKMTVDQHGKVFVNSLASMFFPTREFMKYQAGGRTQGADQLPWNTAPTYYADGGDAEGRQDKKEAAFESLKETEKQYVLENFLPFIGHSSASLDAANEGMIAAKEQYEERKAAAEENIPGGGSSDSPFSWDEGSGGFEWDEGLGGFEWDEKEESPFSWVD